MAATAPTIISRQQWGAQPLWTPAGPISIPSEELWLHHSGGEQFGAAGMRMLQQFTLHRPDEHYVDLEYSFCVDHESCEIFESRGVGKNTAATGGWKLLPFPRRHNTISHAVCVFGNFQNVEPSDRLILTLANLAAYGYEQGWWKTCGFSGGHRDASGNATACPGNKLEAKLQRINALALQIHTAGTAVAPAPQPKVKPMYSPPLVLQPIAASLPCPTGGAWLASVDGAIYAFGGAPYPKGGGANGKRWFAGRRVASLALPNAAEKAAGYILIVIATSKERYGLGAG